MSRILQTYTSKLHKYSLKPIPPETQDDICSITSCRNGSLTCFPHFNHVLEKVILHMQDSVWKAILLLLFIGFYFCSKFPLPMEQILISSEMQNHPPFYFCTQPSAFVLFTPGTIFCSQRLALGAESEPLVPPTFHEWLRPPHTLKVMLSGFRWPLDSVYIKIIFRRVNDRVTSTF